MSPVNLPEAVAVPERRFPQSRVMSIRTFFIVTSANDYLIVSSFSMTGHMVSTLKLMNYFQSFSPASVFPLILLLFPTGRVSEWFHFFMVHGKGERTGMVCCRSVENDNRFFCR